VLEDMPDRRNAFFDEAMSHDAAPLITIIVAVFNGKATLQQCIDSVAQQTYPNRELIIIDGGSNDGTADLLKANQDKLSYWISERDRGIYNAWNKGLAQAQGEWICFLGADDYLWDDTVLEQMALQLEALPENIRVAYGKIMLISADRSLPPHPVGEPWDQIKDFFQQFMCIPHVGTMHRRTLFERHGKFDESFRIAGDYEMLLRELATCDAVFFPGITTAAQRLGGISSDAVNYLATLHEVWRAQRLHGKLLPGTFLSKAFAKEYLRRLLWKMFGERYGKRVFALIRHLKPGNYFSPNKGE
jgi:glycosyltransferase involved in cell wall biosynthesis